jgi:hypothetical protein
MNITSKMPVKRENAVPAKRKRAVPAKRKRAAPARDAMTETPNGNFWTLDSNRWNSTSSATI